jgi:hypothetical protein
MSGAIPAVAVLNAISVEANVTTESSVKFRKIEHVSIEIGFNVVMVKHPAITAQTVNRRCKRSHTN